MKEQEYKPMPSEGEKLINKLNELLKPSKEPKEFIIYCNLELRDKLEKVIEDDLVRQGIL